jgi:hypothetical protein
MALISPTSGGRSIGIVRSRTRATEFFPHLGWCTSSVLVSCLAYPSTMKMTAICSSETSVDFHWAAPLCIPEEERQILQKKEENEYDILFDYNLLKIVLMINTSTVFFMFMTTYV